MLAVFRKAFRDSRRTIFWLSVGLGLYALFVVSFYPSMIEQSEQMNELIQSYPDEMVELFYGQSADEVNLTDVGGFIHSQFALWMILILGGIVVYQAFNATINEERSGAMDVLMSLPISRRDMLLGRMLNTAVGVFIVLTVCVLAFVLGGVLIPEFEVSLGDLMVGIYGAFLPLMIIAAFTYMLGAVFPSSRKFMGSAAYLFLFGSYLLYSFSVMIEDLKPLQPFLLFKYYVASDLIREGVKVEEWALLAVVMLVYGGVALWGIERKELGV